VTQLLKAPFPYFGGKSRVCRLLWERLGDVDNYIVPFCGSIPDILLRPTEHLRRVETVNDLDCHIANFWRATQHDPEAVVRWCDWPVNECDQHARHRWLVYSDDAAAFRERMRTDPDYYDPKIAGLWCWGLCMWIGSGWCKQPTMLQSLSHKIPRAARRSGKGTGGNSTGVHAERPGGGKRPLLGGRSRRDNGHGVHRVAAEEADVMAKIPQLSDSGGRGVITQGRPQLSDAYARGRGAHGNDRAMTCAQRTAWLLDWFSRLRDRLRVVRVCCGDWKRVCSSPSITTRLGLTGIFFDPPYGTKAERSPDLYSHDSLEMAGEVQTYCRERGGDPSFRIALCGYEGEHNVLEASAWTKLAWKPTFGYGSRTAKGRASTKKERIWFSPHCLKTTEQTLFD